MGVCTLAEFSLEAIGEVVLLSCCSGPEKTEGHGASGSEGGASCMDSICDFLLSTDIRVGCLEVGARILSELCLEAIFVMSMRRCSKIRIDDSAIIKKINSTVGDNQNMY